MLSDLEVQTLTERAEKVRETIIEMLVEAGSGHTAGPLGMADIFSLLFFHVLKHDPKNPEWADRDRVVLSNGHICPVQYAVMAHSGYFPMEEIKTLRKLHTRLQGHPHREYLPGIEVSSGPLGSGFAQAVGMAIADRRDKVENRYIYAMISDGEHDSGIIWEAGLLAAREKVGNLIAIVDRNNIQIDGLTSDIMPLEPLRDKWKAFNWHVQEVDGHDFRALARAIQTAKEEKDQPSMIIARTIPGKGVPEFECDFHWHGKPPSKEEGARAVKALRSLGGKITSEHQ